MNEFIPADCHNIVMDMPPIGWEGGFNCVALSLDDLKRIRDAGAQVALEFVRWTVIEPKRGAYNWSMPDEQVERCRKAGLRAMLMIPNDVPKWCPDDWYVQTIDGKTLREVDFTNNLTRATIWGAFSPWCEEAQAYQNLFIQMACERYNADDVVCIQSHSRDGEAQLPPGVAAVFDPHAVESFHAHFGANAIPNTASEEAQQWMMQSCLNVVLGQQEIYVENPYRLVSMQIHPYYGMWPNSGNHFIYGYIKAIQEVIQPSTFLSILFTVYDNGHDAFIFPYIQRIQQEWGVQVIAGSEWPEGLHRNTALAIIHNLRALLTCPIHPYLKREHCEEWMFQAFRESHEAFAAAHTRVPVVV